MGELSPVGRGLMMSEQAHVGEQLPSQLLERPHARKLARDATGERVGVNSAARRVRGAQG